MAEVAEAVDYAHKVRVLHRDLKPANVMVEPNGHSWVIDFGLVAAFNCNAKIKKGEYSGLQSNRPCGTRPYS